VADRPPGVAAVAAGPGVTNTLTAVKKAQMAQSPVVVLGGAFLAVSNSHTATLFDVVWYLLSVSTCCRPYPTTWPLQA